MAYDKILTLKVAKGSKKARRGDPEMCNGSDGGIQQVWAMAMMAKTVVTVTKASLISHCGHLHNTL